MTTFIRSDLFIIGKIDARPCHNIFTGQWTDWTSADLAMKVSPLRNKYVCASI